MNKSSKRFFLMLIVAVLMFSLVPAISFAATTTSTDKTDTNSIEITSKAKTVNYKITWNGNGGKIESKKTVSTSVKKGSKIAKLATTPKRSGYTFKGWYTKKIGGIKISKNTKPTKSISYYAQWTKKSGPMVLNAEEKKLVGTWLDRPDQTLNGQWRYIQFNTDGTFVSVWSQIWYSGNLRFQGAKITQKGNFKALNGKITTSNVKETLEEKMSGYGPNYKDKGIKLPVMTYKFLDTDMYSIYKGEFINISNVRFFGDAGHVYTRMGSSSP